MKEKDSYDWDYKGNEYLQIYPQIEYNKAFTNIWGESFEEGYYVKKLVDREGVRYITELSKWLKQ